MKLEAATITPGFANSGQNAVEPSAKSIQSVFFCGSEHSPWARACPGRNPATATAATTPTRSFLIARLSSRSWGRRPCQDEASIVGGPGSPHGLFLVERGLDLGDFLGLRLLELGRVVGAVLRATAEAAHLELCEVDLAATVAGADLLERLQQALLGLGLGVDGGRHRLGGADLDRAVALQT